MTLGTYLILVYNGISCSKFLDLITFLYFRIYRKKLNIHHIISSRIFMVTHVDLLNETEITKPCSNYKRLSSKF